MFKTRRSLLVLGALLALVVLVGSVAVAQEPPAEEDTFLPVVQKDGQQWGRVTIPPGFTPDPGVVIVGGVRPPVADLTPYKQFPDTYGAWGPPLAGYRYEKNDWCDTPDFHCSLQLPAWHWLVLTAEELRIPGVGTIRDPYGGAALLLMVDRPDDTYRWDNSNAVFVQAGFMATGRVWDMSQEVHTHNVEAVIRDYFLYQLGWNLDFVGECDSSRLCRTVTYVTVQRWFDGKWHLTGAGEWRRVGQPTNLEEKYIPLEFKEIHEQFLADRNRER